MTQWVVAADAEGEPTEATCAHLGGIECAPNVQGECEDCVREGSTWVHLRACLQCGHVACCDNSPRRHATAHFAGTAHPLMRSLEPGEDWGWCYADDLLLVPDDNP
jgi:uncharacterized UBP type Zn finger protein